MRENSSRCARGGAGRIEFRGPLPLVASLDNLLGCGVLSTQYTGLRRSGYCCHRPCDNIASHHKASSSLSIIQFCCTYGVKSVASVGSIIACPVCLCLHLLQGRHLRSTSHSTKALAIFPSRDTLAWHSPLAYHEQLHFS